MPRAIRWEGAWRVQGVGTPPVDPDPDPDPDPEEPELPPGVASYWTTAAPVTGGWQLDPTLGKKAGLPPGLNLTPASSNSISQSDVIISDRSFSGAVTVTGQNVTFLRCRFTASGYVAHSTPGNTTYVMQSTTAPTFIDCEFYGGSSITAFGGGTFLRCLFAEGNDILRVRTTVNLTECVFDGCLRASSSSHSDCIQGTTNSPSTTRYVLNITRSWVNAYNRFTNDPHNAVVQSGSWGDPTGGMSGLFQDNYFDGGNYSFNANGGHTDPKFVLRRNRFGRNQRYGLFASAFSSRMDADNTNVYADTLEPV